MRSGKLKKYFALLLLIACASCFAPQLLRAQDSNDSEDDDWSDAAVPSLGLTVIFAPNDTAGVTFSAYVPNGSAEEFLPQVEMALGCKLQPARKPRNAFYVDAGTCTLNSGKTGLLRTKIISLSQLTEVAKNHGIQAFSLHIELPDTDASETLPRAPASPLSTAALPASVRKKLGLSSSYVWRDLSAVPLIIRVQYGYSQGTILRAGAILIGFLLLPMILISWLGRRALAAPPDRAAAVWFSYMRYLAWTLNFSLIGWFATVESLHCSRLLHFIMTPAKSEYKWLATASYEALLWCTPVAFWIACLVLSKPVQEKLRGVSWTQRELALQALYSFCGSYIPLAMWIGALIYVTSGAYRTAVILFVGAIVIKLFAKGNLANLLGMQPHALTSGDLRDVAFAIAQRLGVPLQQIFLIPSGKGRMANAFARTGNTIAFTDYLLNQMTKREVNFVVAHELTHLQKKHPNKLASIGVGVAVGVGMVIGTFRAFLEISPFFTYAVIISVSTLVTYTFTRRFEYEADAGAVAATGDPQAAICALFKLAQLNLHPLQWSAWSEKWLTHPSMMRRAKAIAALAQIPEVSIPEMAARGVEPGLHYALPDGSQIKTKVLSTAQKARSLRSLVFLLLGVALFPPAIAAFAAQRFPALLPHHYLIYGAGIAVALALHLFVSNFMSKWRLRPLVERMKSKLESEGAVQAEAWGGIPVGLSPADRPRTYEGLTHWDLGFLFLRSDRICYVGEETAFSLRHNQVADLRLGPGNPAWIRGHRIYIAWKDEERRASGVFSIAAASPEPATKLCTLTGDLFQQLDRWRNARSASRPLPEPLAQLESPQLREVTSQVPGASLKGQKLFNEFFLTGLFAIMVALLFGLPFHLVAYLTRIALPGQNPFPGAGAGWFVVAAALTIRLFQIAPLFAYKDAEVVTAAAIVGGTRQAAKAASRPVAQLEERATTVVEKK